jgi:hypothetical protein
MKTLFALVAVGAVIAAPAFAPAPTGHKYARASNQDGRPECTSMRRIITHPGMTAMVMPT